MPYMVLSFCLSKKAFIKLSLPFPLCAKYVLLNESKNQNKNGKPYMVRLCYLGCSLLITIVHLRLTKSLLSSLLTISDLQSVYLFKESQAVNIYLLLFYCFYYVVWYVRKALYFDIIFIFAFS